MSTPEWANLYSGVNGAIGIPVCAVVLLYPVAMIMLACACRCPDPQNPGIPGSGVQMSTSTWSLRNAGMDHACVTMRFWRAGAICSGMSGMFTMWHRCACVTPELDVLEWCWTCGAPDCGGVYQDE